MVMEATGPPAAVLEAEVVGLSPAPPPPQPATSSGSNAKMTPHNVFFLMMASFGSINF
jgi:hypothetical protein